MLIDDGLSAARLSRWQEGPSPRQTGLVFRAGMRVVIYSALLAPVF